MTSTAPRLSAMNINVRYGSHSIVKDAGLVLNAGELTILAGPNGAGKTTLARAMAGLSQYEGKVLLNGVAISDLPPRERAKAMSYLPQGHQYHCRCRSQTSSRWDASLIPICSAVARLPIGKRSRPRCE